MDVQVDLVHPDDPMETEAVWSGIWDQLPPDGSTIEIRSYTPERLPNGMDIPRQRDRVFRIMHTHLIMTDRPVQVLPGRGLVVPNASAIVFVEEIEPMAAMPGGRGYRK